MKFTLWSRNLFVLGVITMTLVAGGPASAQKSELPLRFETYRWSSGVFDGPVTTASAYSESAVLTSQKVIEVPEAPWLRLRFSDSWLGQKSYIEITSLLDGATQHLDAASLEQWAYHSAYFNGNAVEVRLFVAPGDKNVSVGVSQVVIGERKSAKSRTICNGVDDRIDSSEPRVGRIEPIGCTAFIIDNGKHLTAGHCLAANSGQNTLSFNIPKSLPDGTLQFPGPEDQYTIDRDSFAYSIGGPGTDWGVFTVFDNSQTRDQPIERQGSFTVVQDRTPANIRITGFGVDDGSDNQTNQTHVGPNDDSDFYILSYITDTKGGNSGSPVIDDATGRVLGIHGQGGCWSGGGRNYGTSFYNPELWTAIRARTVSMNPQ